MLIKGGVVAKDPYLPVADGDPLPASAALVSLNRFLAGPEELLARGYPLGVRLAGGDSPTSLGPYAERLALIVLELGYFRDGRAFSWARLLRTRLGFRGEIRVTGHFLLDQIAFFTRVGVDGFEVPERFSPERIAAALREITDVYQPAVDGRPTIAEFRAGRRAASPA
jgi:uncharacterized protein (DUF934 family)